VVDAQVGVVVSQGNVKITLGSVSHAG
jgi:hypothetical protein